MYLYCIIGYFCLPLIKNKASASEDSKGYNILILNSYHQGLSWTQHEMEGILNTLEQGDENYNIMVEYMDWKNLRQSKICNIFISIYKYKYQSHQIDIMITTDDSALQFALDHREEIFLGCSDRILWC